MNSSELIFEKAASFMEVTHWPCLNEKNITNKLTSTPIIQIKIDVGNKKVLALEVGIYLRG